MLKKNYQAKKRAARLFAACAVALMACVAAPGRAEAESAAYFEEPIQGATGFPVCDMELKEMQSDSSAAASVIPAGEPFCIMEESGQWWKVEYDGETGYVRHGYCMVNLPDVMPSISYEIANASSSIYQSSGYGLPGVTGTKLYSAGKIDNERLGKKEYICPVVYSTAKKISIAQHNALAEGYSLKIFDSYRPSSVTTKIRDSLALLYSSNATVQDGIDYSTGLSGTRYLWGQGWFLAQCVSAHNVGAAIDVSLVEARTGNEVEMPTQMHELSTAAIKYYGPNAAKIPENYASTMTDGAKELDKFFSGTGMSTLSSEWWHFQDDEAYKRIQSVVPGGCDFQVAGIVSKAP